jgi:hypothetical protein
MQKTKLSKASPFAEVAEALTHVRVSTTAETTWDAIDLLEVARSWPHFVDGKREPRPGGEGWNVEVRSRRRLSASEFRAWLREAEKRRAAREREAARRQRDEARRAAEQTKEYRAKLRKAAAVIVAAQAASRPGPRAAYLYDEPSGRANLVPIVGRAGILFVRRPTKRSEYIFVHESTGFGLPAPGREVVRTKARAVELLELAARPEVVTALRTALARGARRELVDAFYEAWAAKPHARGPAHPSPFSALAAAFASAKPSRRHAGRAAS